MIKRAICFLLFGHRLRVVQEFSQHSRRIYCDRCKGDWGMNDDVRAVVKWDHELEALYRSFGHYILKP